ncbi:hypothetical protein GF336_00230 [Candidatus Woesearchaeota archaeon]|nr:hypothetical protein [Candidatus Woesearchaeota archaeon]
MDKKLRKGIILDDIEEEELSERDKKKLEKFKKNIEEGLPNLEIGFRAVTDGIKQIRELKDKTEEEKIKLEVKIRKDIIKSLMKTSDVVELTDESGAEETKETLEEKSTEELIEILRKSINELRNFVEGR